MRVECGICEQWDGFPKHTHKIATPQLDSNPPLPASLDKQAGHRKNVVALGTLNKCLMGLGGAYRRFFCMNLPRFGNSTR